MNYHYLVYLSLIVLLISYYITEYTHLTHTDRVLSRLYPTTLKKEDSVLSRKIVGTETLQILDPFLHFTHFKLKKGQGLPDHPHRGYDTITYVLKGELAYEDFHNNSGLLKSGDCQYISSGKGIVHAEISATDSEILQVWVDVKLHSKFENLFIQTFQSEELTTATGDGIVSKIISGETLGKVSYTITRNPGFIIDTIMMNDAVWDIDIPAGWNSMIYLLSGEIKVGEDSLRQYEAAMLSQWDTDLKVKCIGKCRVFLIAGETVEETMVVFGQFYMPDYPLAEKAHRDWKEGKDGFEGAVEWKSRIANGNF